ncbi:MAG: hypothetical protein Q4G47_08035 [Lachnospiraceae bacterium]|nr:hypothetical protein [Lachnospiraceae bacterium]
MEKDEKEIEEGLIRRLKLVDEAARGSIEAAADLAEGYLRGSFEGDPDPVKALKWSRYAAKRGSVKAAVILSELGGQI